MIVSDIAGFYRTSLGQAVRDVLARKIESALPIRADLRVLGLGYALPYLAPQDLTIQFMLARGGALVWPEQGRNRVALVDELNLPLGDHSIDAALVVHGLEFCENAEDMLHDIWRVLAPQGRLVLIVPYRRGFWARSEASPFGLGQPFSRKHIYAVMRAAQFEVTRLTPALIAPPWLGSVALKKLELAERIGFGGGVLVVEALKTVHGFLPKRVALRALPRLRPALSGLRQVRQG